MIVRESPTPSTRTPSRSDSEPSAESAVARVRRKLEALGGREALRVRWQAPHIVIDRGDTPVARLTRLGQETFGLSFRTPAGQWEPMALVDALEELIADVTVALDWAPTYAS